MRVRWLFTLVAEIPKGRARVMTWEAVSFRRARTNIPKRRVRVELGNMIARI
jgi:hypothetical protein